MSWNFLLSNYLPSYLWGERSDYAPPDEVDYFFLGNFAMGSASTHFVNYLLQQLHTSYALSLAEVAQWYPNDINPTL